MKSFEERLSILDNQLGGRCDDCHDSGESTQCPYMLLREGEEESVTLCEGCYADRKKDAGLRTYDQWNENGCGIQRGSKAKGFRHGLPLFDRSQVYKKSSY